VERGTQAVICTIVIAIEVSMTFKFHSCDSSLLQSKRICDSSCFTIANRLAVAPLVSLSHHT
jgi:hypothetical protein